MKAEDGIKKILNSNLPLDVQRDILKRNSYSDAHPASQTYRDAMHYAAALKQFDADHPDIIASIIEVEKIKNVEKRNNAKNLGWI